LLVAVLRGVTARVIGGGVLGELVLCVKHGFTPIDEPPTDFLTANEKS